MRILLTGWLVSLLAGCTVPVGDYCDLYSEVHLKRPVAAYVVANDRQAAETIAANNASYGACP